MTRPGKIGLSAWPIISGSGGMGGISVPPPDLAYEDLTDVDMSGIADGDVATWDAGTSTWLPGTGSTGPAFATPAIALGTAAAAGAASTVIRSDSTIVAFDATVPTTIAFSDAAATGSAAVAARRDHRHGAPAAPSATSQHILLADGRGTPFTFDDMLQMDDGSDFMWSDP